MANVPHFDDGNFESEVEKSEIPVLVDFSATWCGPCKRQAPIVESLAKKWDGKVKVGMVDIDAAPQTAAKFNVTSVPRLLIFVGGEVHDQMIGWTSESVLDGKLGAVSS